MQIVIKMLHGGASGSSVIFLHARSVVGPPEVRFAHPVRLPPDTHSQGHGRPCLRRPHHRPGFYETGILAAGRGHTAILEALIFNEL